MNSIAPIFSPTQKPDFIHLKNKVFAEYNIIYHINDGYSIKDLTRFSFKDQLLFYKFSCKIQQMNLMLVDSIFPIHFSDLVLETFLNNLSSFSEYINLKKMFTVFDSKKDKDYFTYKFRSFIELLLYSNISSNEVCNGDIESERVYYFKNDSGEITYYSIFERKQLKDLLLDKLKLIINLKKSFFINDEVCLNFKIIMG